MQGRSDRAGAPQTAAGAWDAPAWDVGSWEETSSNASAATQSHQPDILAEVCTAPVYYPALCMLMRLMNMSTMCMGSAICA